MKTLPTYDCLAHAEKANVWVIRENGSPIAFAPCEAFARAIVRALRAEYQDTMFLRPMLLGGALWSSS